VATAVLALFGQACPWAFLTAVVTGYLLVGIYEWTTHPTCNSVTVAPSTTGRDAMRMVLKATLDTEKSGRVL
jgi:hypothetical protein